MIGPLDGSTILLGVYLGGLAANLLVSLGVAMEQRERMDWMDVAASVCWPASNGLYFLKALREYRPWY